MAVIEKTRRRRMAMRKRDLIDEIERLESNQSRTPDTGQATNDPEIALQESERRLLAVIENMPAVAFLRDLDGRFSLINRSYETTYDVSRAHVLGQPLSEVFADGRAEEFAGQDDEVARTGRAIDYEQSIQLSGLNRYFDCVRFPVANVNGDIVAIGGIEYDITDLKRANEARGASEALFHSIFESIEYGVLLLDPDFNIEMANRAYREIWDLPVEFIANRPSLRDEMALAHEKNLYTVPEGEWDDYVETRI
jgi:PAS domain S-box-containing protein